jgi:hypothetical protein
MVDEEVENTLREIRERVRRTAEQEAPAEEAISSANVSNRTKNTSVIGASETTARIDAYLTTTARAWDRLPPLVSNRSGGLARLELWVKRRFKQATRWYSWEQINFNAAVHHALRDTLDALLDLENQIGQQRAELNAEIESRARLSELELSTLKSEIESQRMYLESQRTRLESQRAEFESYRAQVEAERRVRTLEINARLADLGRELREREGQRLDEERVSFKQLSLEMSETEVLLDRARRDIEARLEKLERSKRKS